MITGSVTELAAAGQQAAEELGYEPWLLTTSLNCQAKEAGSFLAAIGRQYAASGKRWRYWPGARRWSTSMAGAREAGTRKSPFRLPTALQDWTMWRCSPLAATAPTAPRMQPGVTETDIRRKTPGAGLAISDVLDKNDAYHALEKTGGLLITGATGTNVNDLSVLLIG